MFRIKAALRCRVPTTVDKFSLPKTVNSNHCFQRGHEDLFNIDSKFAEKLSAELMVSNITYLACVKTVLSIYRFSALENKYSQGEKLYKISCSNPRVR